MNYKNLIYSILAVMAIGFVFNKFKINIEKDDKLRDLNLIKEYLLEDNLDINNSINLIKKPIIWIHIDYKKNSRNWESFGSRNTNELNQDYIYLTLNSIIRKCSDYFHIILIDDNSFKNLLSDWKIDVSKISSNLQTNYRTLGIMKILYKYGGIHMENSFILFKSLKNIYEKILDTGKMVVLEESNNNLNSNEMMYSPSIKFLGCKKNCEKIHELIHYLEQIYSKDYTNNITLENHIGKWLYGNIETNNINYIDGKFFGIKDIKNNKVNLEDLMSSTFLDLDLNSYGLYIPRDDLLKRVCFNWFCYLNTKEILNSNTNIGKYLLLSNN